MKIINIFKSILSGLYLSIRRFPITIVLSTTAAIILIVISETKPVEDTLSKITMALALGIPLSLCLKLIYEKREKNRFYELIIYYIIGALFTVLYYFYFIRDFNMVTITRYAAVMVALFLAFLFIPYLPEKEQFEMYVIKIFTGFFTTVIYSVILFAGLAAIIFTINALFSLNINEKIYFYTWLFVVFVFAPTYFLAGVPHKNVKYETEDYPKLLRILLLYIVMLLLTVYTAILYAYFIKILATRQWPIGLVSHLVLWYSVIVVFVLFFIYPLKDKNRWADIFLVWMPMAIIPLQLMMFASMKIRIDAYGITENRYFVLALGFWALGMMIYFCISKNRKNIITTIALAIIALISVFGPVSSYSVSKWSQNHRLKQILARNNMLKENKIQPAPAAVSADDKNEASRILDYFSNNHSFKDIKYIPQDFKMEDMEKVFGFPYEAPRHYSPDNFFYLTRDGAGENIDIRGYDYLVDGRNLYQKTNGKDNALNVVYDVESAVIDISSNRNIVYHKDLNTFIRETVEKYRSPGKENIALPEDMTFEDENDKIKVKFVFMHISGQRDNSPAGIKINGAEFYVLIKVK